MKLLGAVFAVGVGLLLYGCPGPIKPLPNGAIPCQTVYDCPDKDNWICGFQGVDTPSQCLWSPGPAELKKYRIDAGSPDQ